MCAFLLAPLTYSLALVAESFATPAFSVYPQIGAFLCEQPQASMRAQTHCVETRACQSRASADLRTSSAVCEDAVRAEPRHSRRVREAMERKKATTGRETRLSVVGKILELQILLDYVILDLLHVQLAAPC
eukprot:6178935-Pleurochrysis_carterae.AAC.4